MSEITAPPSAAFVARLPVIERWRWHAAWAVGAGELLRRVRQVLDVER